MTHQHIITLIVFAIILVNTPKSLKIESQCFPFDLKDRSVVLL